MIKRHTNTRHSTDILTASFYLQTLLIAIPRFDDAMKVLFVVSLIVLITVDAKKAADQPTAAVKEPKPKEEKKKESRDLEYNVKRCPVGWYRYENTKCFKYVADLGN